MNEVVVGPFIGAVICFGVVWVQMKPRSDGDAASGTGVSSENRYTALERITAIYCPISFICLLVAVINGGGAFLWTAGANAVLAVAALFLVRRERRSHR